MPLVDLFSAVAPPSSRTWWQRYGFAIGVVLLAWLAREAITSAVGSTALPFIFFFPAVTVAAWYSGLRPALLSILLSAALAYTFFVDPIVDPIYDIVSLIAFVTGCLLIIGALETLHRTTAQRERGEKERAKAQHILSTTLASIGDGVIVTDEIGHVTFLNPEAERLTGWKLAEATGQPLTTVFHIVNEDTRKALEDPAEKVLRTGNIIGLANHTILISKNGTDTPIDDSAAPIQTTDGPAYGVVLVFRDVTEQRKADYERARLAAIVQFSGDAIITKNLKGIVQTWNAAAERLLGYKAEEIVGRSITQIIPPDRMSEESEILSRIRSGQPYERLETVRVGKGGKPLHVSVSISPLKDSDGNVVGASKILHDVSDILSAREALAKESELLATTLKSIGDAVIVTDAQGLITFINSEGERLTGWKQADAAGKQLPVVFRIVNEETRATVENPVDKVLRTGSVVGLANHTLLIAKDGTEIPIDDSAAPIVPAGGSLLGVVLVFRDFTARRNAERALREEAKRKDEFLAILSHELRNPLAPISIAVEILQRTGPQDPQLKKLRDVIERQTKQLTRLLDDLLDMSRISSGKISLKRERLDLSVAVSSAVESIRPQMDSKNHELSVELPHKPVFVDGDGVRLAQVVANLLSNAARYSDPGGRIELKVDREGTDAVIRVRDHGIGISSDQMSRIFDMFTQVHHSFEGAQGGLGVGLSLSKQLVGLHGGSIEAKSAGLGKGSEFVVHIPLATIPHSQDAQSSPVHAESAAVRYRILVADDNQDSAAVLSSLLSSEGHDVHAVHDGVKAVEAVQAFQPNVAILDIGMPGMNGYDAARKIRAQFGKGVVLIAVTGWGQEQDKQRSKEAGFDYHFTKPIDVSALEKILAQLH
jgi:PAS domain S-box-containing protein